MSPTKPFGDITQAKVLVIGHDPRLQSSNTIAEYCFFADYYFRDVPQSSSENAKYRLAAALFSYVDYITSQKYHPEQIYITNLSNMELEHAPKGKTVLIPKDIAEKGVFDIKQIIDESLKEGNPGIELILALSQQVNYWLQVFGFYQSTENYLANSEPDQKGLANNYQPKGKSPFLEICGKRFIAYRNIPLYPVLHVKQYPFKGNIKENYLPLHEACIRVLQSEEIP